MAFNLGDVFVTFKSKSVGFKESMAEVKNLGTSAEKTGGKLNNTAKQLIGFALKAAAAFGGMKAAVNIFKNAADFEQTRVGLENMLGSADKARGVLQEVSEFAAKTPFEFPELAQSVRQLTAFGFKAGDAIMTMKMLGDVSAAIGAPMSDLTYLMGTMRAQGRAMAIDIRQFAMRGIPIYEYLAKVLDTNVENISDMISAGEIGFPEVEKAFKRMTSEGEVFHGTMEKQSRTAHGLLSTLRDNLGFAFRELVGINMAGDIRQGSVLDKLKTGIDALNRVMPQLIDNFNKFMGRVFAFGSAVADYLRPRVMDLWYAFADLIPTLKSLWQEILAPLAVVLGATVLTAINLVLDATILFTRMLKPLIDTVVRFKDVMIAMGVAMLGWQILGAIDKVKIALISQGGLKGALTNIMSNLRSGSWAQAWGAWSTVATGAIALVAVKAMHVISTLNATKAALGIFDRTQAQLDDRIRGLLSKGKLTKAEQTTLNHLLKAQVDAAKGAAAVARSQGGIWDVIRDSNTMGSILPGFASGGQFKAGEPFIAGETGREMIFPKTDGRVISNEQTERMAAGGNEYHIHLHKGLVARSRTEMADIIIEGIKAADERLSASGKPKIMPAGA